MDPPESKEKSKFEKKSFKYVPVLLTSNYLYSKGFFACLYDLVYAHAYMDVNNYTCLYFIFVHPRKNIIMQDPQNHPPLSQRHYSLEKKFRKKKYPQERGRS